MCVCMYVCYKHACIGSLKMLARHPALRLWYPGVLTHTHTHTHTPTHPPQPHNATHTHTHTHARARAQRYKHTHTHTHRGTHTHKQRSLERLSRQASLFLPYVCGVLECCWARVCCVRYDYALNIYFSCYLCVCMYVCVCVRYNYALKIYFNC
jgi:hypothetical protein